MRKPCNSLDFPKLFVKGLNIVSPIFNEPSKHPPFRAVIEAAGTPDGEPGKGRLTRKRCVGLMMSVGLDKRQAEALAYYAHINIGYREVLRRILVPLILQADAAMARYRENREALMRVQKKDDQEG